MNYTVSQAASRMGITAHTLRFYDREGLLPFVSRSKSGIRQFKEEDFEWLSVIECLKNTGMPIKDIKLFINWCMEGDSTLKERLDMFHARKLEAEHQIEALQKSLDKINYKCWYYETAVAAGTEQVHKASGLGCECNYEEYLKSKEQQTSKS
jgi:Predicted transcriptional regulators